MHGLPPAAETCHVRKPVKINLANSNQKTPLAKEQWRFDIQIPLMPNANKEATPFGG